MTEFTRLRIDFQHYTRVVDHAPLVKSLGGRIEEGRHRRASESLIDFIQSVDYLWREMLCREKEGAFQLDHSPPDEFLARITVDKIRVSGLVEVLTLLGKAAGMERTKGGETRWSVAEGDSRFIAACQQGLVMAAISRLKEHLRLKREDLEAVLALKQTFDSLPADQFRHWNGLGAVRNPARRPSPAPAVS